MPIHFQGQNYDLVPQDKLTPGEVDAVERVTGLTLQKIRRLGENCVCEHGVKAHTHTENAEDTSCRLCDCEAHESDVPSRITTAFMWVSVKRGNHSVKYDDIANIPYAELLVEDDDAADPTDPPQESGAAADPQ